MNFNWRAAIIAFVVTFVIIILDTKFGDLPFLFLAGATIGGLIAGYMAQGYMEGILNGAFPVSLAITAIMALSISDIGYALLVGMFPVLFIISLIGPTIGVTIKKIKNKDLKYYNKFFNSNKVVMDRNDMDSTYTEKQVSKSKKIDMWEAIFIGIVSILIIVGMLEIFLFSMVMILLYLWLHLELLF